MNHNIPTAHEKPKFESGVEYKDKEGQQLVGGELIAGTAEWAANNRAKIDQMHKEDTGHMVGMRLDDFRGIVGKMAPGLSEEDNMKHASRLFNDVMRFNKGIPMPDDPARLDTTSSTAIVSTNEVMKYGVHTMKDSGIPFEGKVAEDAEAAVKAEFAAQGWDIDGPNAQLLIKEILATE